MDFKSILIETATENVCSVQAENMNRNKNVNMDICYEPIPIQIK